MNRPDCGNCVHRQNIMGDAHIRCKNGKAIVEGHRVGVNGGWFNWPNNFDSNWLLSCDGFQAMSDNKVLENE